MPKTHHSKDKLYLNQKEFAEFWGGFKDKAKVPFHFLPFNCCALSLLPFDDPVCTREGHVFDIKRIIPYIKKHGRNPVTGQPLKVQDLTAIIWHKNSEGKYHCPVTFKVFTDNTHIVANRKSGHVYEHATIEQLCKKTKSWKDLITGESFSNSDVVHLNNPADTQHRAVIDFHHVVQGQDVSVGDVDKEKGIRASGAMERIFMEKRKREEDAAARETEDALNGPLKEEKKEQAPPEKRSRNERFTSGAVAASFTSTTAPIAFNNECRENTDEEERQLTYDKVRKAKKKGYARLVTNFGNLNIELHCDIAPTACDNFIRHCQSGYYRNTKFFRLLKNFMMQGGDPDGTGKGGKSAFPGGDTFKDEFDCRLKHDGPGILSMANPGVRNTNKSQFFITFHSAPHCDRKHTVFGRVVGGLDILAVLNELDTDKNDRPLQKIFVKDTVVFTNPFEDVNKEVVKPKVDADAMWFSNKSDPMQAHKQRNATTVGKYLEGKDRTGPTAEEKIDAAIPLKRKTLRTQMDFSVF